jgi:hypothetical protein
VLDREIRRVKDGRVLLIPGSDQTVGHGTTAFVLSDAPGLGLTLDEQELRKRMIPWESSAARAWPVEITLARAARPRSSR